jgi:soluble lytic murein transglycosylase-like protein
MGVAASLAMATSALAVPAGAVAAGEAACDAARTALQSMSAAQKQRFTLTESSCAPSTAATELSVPSAPNAPNVPSAPNAPIAPAAARESMHLQLFQGQGSSVLGRQTHRSVASVAQWSDSSATLRAAAPRVASAHTSRAVQLAPEIDAVARRHNIDPLLMHAIAHVESRHNPQARSHAGALGVMQVMPTTGQRFGVAHRASLHHAPTNLEVSATYLKVLQERFGNNLQLVLAAYNAGEGAVEKYGRRIPPYAETQRYVVAVMATYQSLSATARQVRGKPPAPRGAATAITAM